MRFRLVTASARTRPVSIDDSAPGADCTLDGICPPITSVSACGAPLYEMCTTSIFAVSLSSSIESCGEVPAAEVPYDSFPGCARAYAMKSFTERTGSEGCTTSTLALTPMREIGAKSRSWRYGIFAYSDSAIALEAMLHWNSV